MVKTTDIRKYILDVDSNKKDVSSPMSPAEIAEAVWPSESYEVISSLELQATLANQAWPAVAPDKVDAEGKPRRPVVGTLSNAECRVIAYTNKGIFLHDPANDVRIAPATPAVVRIYYIEDSTIANAEQFWAWYDPDAARKSGSVTTKKRLDVIEVVVKNLRKQQAKLESVEIDPEILQDALFRMCDLKNALSKMPESEKAESMEDSNDAPAEIPSGDSEESESAWTYRGDCSAGV